MSAPARTAVAIAALALGLGCPADQEADVAELTRVLSGSAQRNVDDGPWQPAAVGTRFRDRHAVRTSKDGGARLAFLSGGSLRMGPDTTIRFGPGKVAVEGELEAEQDAVLELEMGRAEIAAGSKVRIGHEGAATRFDVLVGSAVVTREGRDEVVLAAGDALDFELGGSRLERVKRGRPPPADAGPPPEVADAGAVVESADAGAPEPVAGAATAVVKGRSIKARAPGETRWAALGKGEHPLAAGTALSVPRGASVLLTRGDESAEVKGAAELVVVPAGEDGALAETSRGTAVVRAGAADVTVRVPGGVIVARRGAGAGTRANLRVEPRATTIDVDSGVVDVQGGRGGKERLVLGQKGEIARGGGIAVLGRPPARADFTIRAGTSATIHDPAPPSDVRISFAELCKGGGGVLELTRGDSFDASRRRIAGEAAAIARLDRGGHRYRVRCLIDGQAGAEVATGRLRVVKDAGTRPLPRQAPHNSVDADGRPYTVLYQNLLPSITFKWSAAPKAGPYKLVVAPARGKPIEVSGAEARQTLAAGKLAEGEYRYWFEAGGQASKKSVLRIEFDNAAATGYVQSPRSGATWGGPSVEVSGAAVEGWKVSVGGQPLALDRKRRFAAAVSRDPEENGIAVEFRHPSRGVHLYVRRGRKR